MNDGAEAARNPGAALAGMLERARFEVVPVGGVDEQTAFLPHGTTVTVTCSPRKGLERTLEVSERLAGRGFRVVPHLCARQFVDHTQLQQVVRRLNAANIEEVFVVGGDAPDPAGAFTSSLDLLQAMTDLGHPFRRVGVAGYPERHPFIADETLIDALHRKQRHASYIVTQICFDPEAIFGWIQALPDAGIRLPVHIGLPGPLRRRKLLEISLRVGVGDSIRFVAGNRSLVGRLTRRAGYRPSGFISKILSRLGETDGSVAGIHINTFNNVEGAEMWRRAALEEYLPEDIGNREGTSEP